MSEELTLVIAAKVKEAVKGISDDLRISGDFIPALSEKTRELLKDAIGRAEANGRKTLKPTDL